MLSRHSAAGFSLVELMIAVAVLCILLMAALPALGTWVADSRIRSVAESLQNGLRRAQAEAMLSNRRGVFALTSSTPALTARPVDNGSNWYVRLLPLDGSDESDDPDADAQAATRFLGGSNYATQSGVNIAGPALLCFSSLGRQTSLSAEATGLGTACRASDPVRYTVSTAAGGGAPTLRVEVGLGGRVRLCDPEKTLSNEDPDGC